MQLYSKFRGNFFRNQQTTSKIDMKMQKPQNSQNTVNEKKETSEVRGFAQLPPRPLKQHFSVWDDITA